MRDSDVRTGGNHIEAAHGDFAGVGRCDGGREGGGGGHKALVKGRLTKRMRQCRDAMRSASNMQAVHLREEQGAGIGAARHEDDVATGGNLSDAAT
jgi:hypothetical protein